jgi:hypothetical protein
VITGGDDGVAEGPTRRDTAPAPHLGTEQAGTDERGDVRRHGVPVEVLLQCPQRRVDSTVSRWPLMSYDCKTEPETLDVRNPHALGRCDIHAVTIQVSVHGNTITPHSLSLRCHDLLQHGTVPHTEVQHITCSREDLRRTRSRGWVNCDHTTHAASRGATRRPSASKGRAVVTTTHSG